MFSIPFPLSTNRLNTDPFRLISVHVRTNPYPFISTSVYSLPFQFSSSPFYSISNPICSYRLGSPPIPFQSSHPDSNPFLFLKMNSSSQTNILFNSNLNLSSNFHSFSVHYKTVLYISFPFPHKTRHLYSFSSRNIYALFLFFSSQYAPLNSSPFLT